MPAEEWAAEVSIDAPRVRRALAAQFPDLAIESLRLLGEGWDNSVWIVDERWVFRFPRRQVAVEPGERQVVLLPRLGPRLPLPIPRPAFVGRPDEHFPWPFFGSPLLPGREAAAAGPGDARAATALAGFLRALHDPSLLELEGVDDLPHDPNRRADMSFRVPRARARMAELRGLGLWDAPAAVDTILGEAEALPPATGLAVVHGDLHLRHLLVGEDGAPSAVIDWDDLCRADPCIDLLLYWGFLSPAARPAFLDAYPVAEERLLRARVLSLFLCGSVAVYARHEGLPGLESGCVAGLERTMAD
jgi:aminoglycoside phosphotransferase (APT) family kinase protein